MRAQRVDGGAAAEFSRCLVELERLIDAYVAELSAYAEPETPDAPESAARARVQQALEERGRLPDPFFGALLCAAVHHQDPSAVRQFVEPAVAAFGRRHVQRALIDHLRTGADAERAGAARAWYWAQPALHYGVREAMEGGPPTPESRAEYDAVADLAAEWQEVALREFVGNDDLDVRRSLLPGLRLDSRAQPAELRSLVDEAVRIARGHPDPRLRHRVEHQV